MFGAKKSIGKKIFVINFWVKSVLLTFHINRTEFLQIAFEVITTHKLV